MKPCKSLSITILLVLAATAIADLPPMPPGVTPTKPKLLSPKASEFSSSLGSPMVKAAALPVPVPPSGFVLTNITVANGQVTLQWQLGQPCYQVQGTTLNGAWSNIGGLTAAHQTQFQEQTQHFFRLSQSNSMPLTLNSNTQPRLQWQKPDTDMSDSIANFHVYRTADFAVSQTEPPGSWTDLATLTGTDPTTYTDTMPPNPTLYYTVRGNTVNGVKIPYLTVPLSIEASGTAKVLRQLKSGYDTRIMGTAVDSAGKIFVAGWFITSNDFGDGVVNSVNSMDGFLAKYSSTGALLWKVTFPRSGTVAGGTSQALCVAVDSQDNAFVGGIFSCRQMTAGGKTLNRINQNVDSTDAFIFKFSNSDSSGVALWANNYGNGVAAGIGRIAVDADKNLAMAATFTSSVDWGLGAIGPGYYNTGIIKLNGSTGATMKSQAWGGSNGQNLLGDILIDGSGAIVVGGTLTGPTDIGGGATATGGIYIAKYSGSECSYISHSLRAGDATLTGLTSFIEGGLNYYIATGKFSGTIDFGSGNVSSRNTHYSGFAVCYGSSYAHKWQLLFQPPFGDTETSLDNFAARANGGRLVITGDITGGGIYFDTTFVGIGIFATAYAITSTSKTFAWVTGSTGNPIFHAASPTLAFAPNGNAISSVAFAQSANIGGTALTATGKDPVIVQYTR